MDFNFQDFSRIMRSVFKRHDAAPKTTKRKAAPKTTKTSSNADTPQTASKLSRLILNFKKWIGIKKGKNQYSNLSTRTTQKNRASTSTFDEQMDSGNLSESSSDHEKLAQSTDYVGTNILSFQKEDMTEAIPQRSSTDRTKTEDTSQKRASGLQDQEQKEKGHSSQTFSDTLKKTNDYILKNQHLFPQMLDEAGEKQKVKIKPLESGLQQKLILIRGQDDRIYLKIGFQKTEIDAGGFKKVYGENALLLTPQGLEPQNTELVRTIEETGLNDEFPTQESLLGMNTEKYVLLHVEHPCVATAIRARIVTVQSSGSEISSATKYKMITNQEKADGNLSQIPDRALYLQGIQDAAEGLAKLHELGIIHTDVKDNNILVYKKDGKISAKISDFGTAVITNQPDNPDVRTIFRHGGPREYMSPEALECTRREEFGQDASAFRPKVTSQTDVWSLGATLYMRFMNDPSYSEPPWIDNLRFIGMVINEKNLKLFQERCRNFTPEEEIKLSKADKDLILLIADMLKYEPSERPTMRKVIKRLNKINKDSKTST